MPPMIATVDLSGVTGALSSLSTDLVTASAVVITAALGIGAVFFGGRRLWGFFKSLAR